MHITSQGELVPGFEGPEKKLEVHFKATYKKHGLRSISQQGWQLILNAAKCTIISSTKNEHFDSYVLSESSLFVYPSKVILKTCGTTTLLHALPQLIELARANDTNIELVMYSRKNLNNPNKQSFPHTNFYDEVAYLNKMFEGQGFVMGPLNKDHWNLYIADCRIDRAVRSQQTFEIMMHDLDPQVMEYFYQKEGVSGKDTTRMSGIGGLLPGSTIDEFQFEPCGYSMNGLLHEWYWTIHITPEPHCSYVSFETNAHLASYTKLLRKVVSLFRPGRFTVVIMADESAPCGDPIAACDTNVSDFTLQSHTLQTMPNSLSVVVCNYGTNDEVMEPIVG